MQNFGSLSLVDKKLDGQGKFTHPPIPFNKVLQPPNEDG